MTRTAIAFGILTVLIGLMAWRTAERSNTGDLWVYYEAGQRLDRGLDLYNERETERPDHVTGFIYPPPFAIAFVPLSRLPFPLVRGLWFFVMALLAIRAFVVSSRLLGPHASGRALALGLGVLFSFRFVWGDLGHGQVNLLVIALTLEGIYAAENERDGLGGALLALAVVIKITPALVVAAYLLGGRRRLVATSVGVGVGVLLAPSLVFGVGGNLDLLARFVSEVTPWHTDYAVYKTDNLAPTGAISRLFVGSIQVVGQTPRPQWLSWSPGAVEVACKLLSLAFFVGTLTLARLRWQADRVGALALVLAGIPLISPVAWKPHLVVLILPGVLAGRLLLTPGRHRAPLAIAFVLLALTGRLTLGRDGSHVVMVWGLATVGLLLLFVGLAIAPRRRIVSA